MDNKIGVYELELYTKTLTNNMRNAIKFKEKNKIKSHKIFFKWAQLLRK